MFAGHYAPAYAIKKHYPEVPLWTLFVGVQAVDILFGGLVLAGVETVSIDPTQQGPLAMKLGFLPWSHSLLMTLIYGTAAVGIGYAIKKGRWGVAFGLAIMSHWFTDVLVHTPDMHLGLADQPRLGLSLWTIPVVGFLTEVGLVVGAYLYWRPALELPGRTKGDRLITALVVVQILATFVLPPPGSVLQFTASAGAAYVLFALGAWSVERRGGD